MYFCCISADDVKLFDTCVCVLAATVSASPIILFHKVVKYANFAEMF